MNLHKQYSGFCIEFKTPMGSRILTDNQKNLLEWHGEMTIIQMISEANINILRDCLNMIKPYQIIINSLIDILKHTKMNGRPKKMAIKQYKIIRVTC